MCPPATASQGIGRRSVLLGGIAVLAVSSLPKSRSLPIVEPQVAEPIVEAPTFAEWREAFWSNSLRVRDVAIKSLQKSVATGTRTYTVGQYSRTVPDIDESAIQAVVNRYAKALTKVEAELIRETRAPMSAVTETFERFMLHVNHYQPDLYLWNSEFFDSAANKLNLINESFAWRIGNGAYKESDSIREMLEHPLLESSNWKIPHECLFRAFREPIALSNIFERLNPERAAQVRKQFQGPNSELMNSLSSYIPRDEMLAFKIRVSQQLDALIPSLAKQLNVSEVQIIEELRYLMSPHMDLPWNRHYRPRFAIPLNKNDREAIVTAIEGVHLELAAYIRSSLENNELLVGRTLNARYEFFPESINRWQLEALVNDLQTHYPDTPRDHFVWQLVDLARLRMGLDGSRHVGDSSVAVEKALLPNEPEVQTKNPSSLFEEMKSAFGARRVVTSLLRTATDLGLKLREEYWNGCSAILDAPKVKNVDPLSLTEESPLPIQLQAAPMEPVATRE